MAIGAAGKIYVTNYGTNSLTSYEANGTQIKPTITNGLSNLEGIALADS